MRDIIAGRREKNWFRVSRKRSSVEPPAGRHAKRRFRPRKARGSTDTDFAPPSRRNVAPQSESLAPVATTRPTSNPEALIQCEPKRPPQSRRARGDRLPASNASLLQYLPAENAQAPPGRAGPEARSGFGDPCAAREQRSPDRDCRRHHKAR